MLSFFGEGESTRLSDQQVFFALTERSALPLAVDRVAILRWDWRHLLMNKGHARSSRGSRLMAVVPALAVV